MIKENKWTLDFPDVEEREGMARDESQWEDLHKPEGV